MPGTLDTILQSSYKVNTTVPIQETQDTQKQSHQVTQAGSGRVKI